MNDVIADSERMLRRLIPESIELRTRYSPAAGRIEADRGQLEQVLMNLVVNARDAMPDGGEITIATGERSVRNDDVMFPGLRPGQYVTLSVTDTGHGMDASIQQRIFEPFFTTKATSLGTGLGLSTVYGIAQQLGGSIVVESAPGEGARFTIALPRTMAESPSVDPGEAAAAASGHVGSVVLLVEDEPAVRVIAKRLLERDGHHVLVACDGADALEVSQRHAGTVNLLLTDLVMPVMGGRDLAAAIRARRPEIRVVFMTGYSEDAVAGHGLLGQEARLVQKPFSAEGLLRAVREELEQGKLAVAS